MKSTPRINQILKAMLEENGISSVTNLSEKIGVSKRTIQREFAYIPKVLQPYNIELMSKTGVGIWLDGQESDKEKLSDFIENQDLHDVSDMDFRRKMLILELLKEKELKKLFWYSNKFKVSEATISSDLEILEKWLERYNLNIVKKPGYGIFLDGSEESFRKAIRAFISENIDNSVLLDFYEVDFCELEKYNEFKKSGIGQMLSNKTLEKVTRCIMNIEDIKLENFTENAYLGLIIHIAIAINRILGDKTVGFNEKWLSQFDGDREYELAKKIMKELGTEFGIEIPQDEVSYICLHIKGSKNEKIKIEDNDSLENIGITSLVNDIIYAFDKEKAYLLKQDDDFIQGLTAHLKPTIIRLAYDMKIQNPILEDIKKDYSEIFEKCKNVSKILEEWTSKSVPEDEVGYLAVHFGYAMSKITNIKTRVVDIGVICSSGIGISRLMATKIEKIFNEKVNISTYSKKEIDDKIINKEDFFVSSINFKQDGVDIIEVNPFLSEKDIEKIRELFAKHEKTAKKIKEASAFEFEIEKVHQTTNQMVNIIKDFSITKIPNNVNFNECLDSICSNMLKEDGEIVKNDILKRENLATQIYPEFKFALLHTKTNGVKTPTFKAFISDSENFSNSDFKEIMVILLMLSPKDENEKLNADILGRISSYIIEEKAFLKDIYENNIENASKHIDKILKDFLIKSVLK